MFASIAFQEPHILVLDEPSNNLDMESIVALAEAINKFEGGVLLVSHDSRLIEDTGMRLWVLEKQRVMEEDNGIEGYRDEILEKIQKTHEATKANIAAKQAARDAERKVKLAEMEERRKLKKK